MQPNNRIDLTQIQYMTRDALLDLQIENDGILRSIKSKLARNPSDERMQGALRFRLTTAQLIQAHLGRRRRQRNRAIETEFLALAKAELPKEQFDGLLSRAHERATP